MKAQQLIESRYQEMIDQVSISNIDMTNATPLFDGDDRCVIGFMNMQDRSHFVQDAEAKGLSTDELDADAYPEQVPQMYPFLVILWK
jgi:hypothetical protein